MPNSSINILYIFPFSLLLFAFMQAYVQQLETSRIRLSQLEQELQRASSQVGHI